MKTDTIQPTIHWNGTGLRTLQDETSAALGAVVALNVRLQEMTIHPRDYYVQEGGEDNYVVARGAHAEMHRHLEEISDYLYARLQHLSDVELGRAGA